MRSGGIRWGHACAEEPALATQGWRQMSSILIRLPGSRCTMLLIRLFTSADVAGLRKSSPALSVAMCRMHANSDAL